MAGDLQGRVAIITGAGSGMGRATAFRFIEEGAKVAIFDWNEEAGSAVEKQLKDAGGDVLFVKTDVSKAADVENAVQATVDQFGRLDCAFNNAGIGSGPFPLADFPEEDWDRTIAVNLKGVFLCMKYQIPQMLKGGGGSIVNTASVDGLVGLAAVGPYVAAKHGVVGLTKTAALDYATQNIRVNCICPGTIRTELVQSWIDKYPEAEEAWTKLAPMERMGDPKEIAEAAVWLCSDKSSFVTGHPLVVDGGIVIR